eukprot:1229415-Rhodomonas_salina.3
MATTLTQRPAFRARRCRKCHDSYCVGGKSLCPDHEDSVVNATGKRLCSKVEHAPRTLSSILAAGGRFFKLHE